MCSYKMWLLFPQDASGDLSLTPITSKVCNWCTAICLILAAWAHCFYGYSETIPAVTDEDPWTAWFLQLTATLAAAGFFYELCLAILIKWMGLQGVYQEDLTFRRRLRLNRKMMFVFIFLTVTYHLMACDVQYVHKGWIAEYVGGRQIVYSLRYVEWTVCAPIVLSVSGQLKHAENGEPRNALIPSSLLTGIYCIISWQGIVVADFWAAWILIGFAFFCYFAAAVEQLAFAWYIKDKGREGPVRAGLLVYLVVMIGIYGVVYLLPIPGWLSPTMENKFYCVGDASFKLGTAVMLLATNDLANNEEMRRRAEALLADLTRLIDTASVPIFGVDLQGRINNWNQKIAELTGMPAARAVGMPLASMLERAGRQAECNEMIRRAVAGEDPGKLEITLLPTDESDVAQNKRTILALSAAPRVNQKGVVTGVTLVGYDLTEVTAVKEAETRKARFMAVVSHELRSPLHGIIGIMDVLRLSEQDEHRLKLVNMVSNCATRLLDLVVNIMEMTSLMTAGPQKHGSKLSQDPVELPKIIEEIVMLVRSSTDKWGKTLVKPEVKIVNNIGKMPIIQADAYKCTQVFYNLIANACKFTKKGKITMVSEVDPGGQWVEVTVEDTGTGIARSALERIFEPFEQEDTSEARCFEGVGLGLSIAQEVVRRQGGSITVSSEVGVGSAFKVRLPSRIQLETEATQGNPALQLPTASPSAESELPSPAVTQSKKKPLLLSVDDDMVNQTVIQGILEEDYEIHTAMDGFEALEYMRTCTELPQAILLDVMMPGMTGIEVCKVVREKFQFSATSLPILMLSASAVGSCICEAFETGCTDYVTKPFDRMVLRARVKAALQVKMMHQKELEEVKNKFSESKSKVVAAEDLNIGLRRRM